jgi:hypothetical protein
LPVNLPWLLFVRPATPPKAFTAEQARLEVAPAAMTL